MFPKYRGKQVLMRDENDLEKCVACGLCSVACPADAIYLEAQENTAASRPGPRYASVYQIHKTRCIFCGYCEEACPVGAIFMGKDYELAVYSKDRVRLGQGRPARAGLQHQHRRIEDVPSRPALPAPPGRPARPDHDDRRAGRHPRRVRDRSGDHAPARGRAVLAAGGRRREQRRRVLHAGRAALLDQGQQRRLRRGAPQAAAGHPPAPNLHYLRNGALHQVGDWRVAALGGTFAPSWYHAPASALPPSKGHKTTTAFVKLGKSRDDKRRHFVKDEVLACKALTGVDVFLTHEAPRPFYPAGRHIDAGQDRAERNSHDDAPAAAPVRPSPRVHGFGASGRALDRPRHGHQVVSAHPRRHLPLRAAGYVKSRDRNVLTWTSQTFPCIVPKALMAIFEPPSSQPREEFLGTDAATRALSVSGRRKRLRRAGLREHRVGLRRLLRTDAAPWTRPGDSADGHWSRRSRARSRRRHRHQRRALSAIVLGHRHRFLGIDARKGPRSDGPQGHPQRPPVRDGRRRSQVCRRHLRHRLRAVRHQRRIPIRSPSSARCCASAAPAAASSS